MVKLPFISILAGSLLALLVACSADAAPGIGSDQNESSTELTVFAASSLTEALEEVATAFEQESSEVSITFNFAGSQLLRTQLEHGAEAEVFASADWTQMNAVVDAGLVLGEPVNFASNQLVVIVSSFAPQILSLEDLAKPGTKLVLAQPEVPVGGYARTAIDNLAADPQFGPDYAAQVLANVVSEETNVRNVAQKVALGEADAGIIYQTDAMTESIAQEVRVIDIPEQFNVTASYPIAILRGSDASDLAQRFIDFLLSDRGQQILSQHGFGAGQSLYAPEATTITPREGSR
jgi:molybdate transport system substrate-binding protein